jgi:molybdopterin/thiamine biosynthesis adenylyltransferase
MVKPVPLTDVDRAVYQWQLWMPGFTEAHQERLKGSSVLISRIGGVGGTVALYLAAAGVGRLVLAHAGNLRNDDLNRQLLMSHAGVGQPRVEQAAVRLRDLNPRLEVETVAQNIALDNAAALVARADAIAGCAPRFEERLWMNEAAVTARKPLVDAAMYEMDAQLAVVVPGKTACLACLYPQVPVLWERQFPVFGAVAGTIASLAALELIKLLSGYGTPLGEHLLLADLDRLDFRKVQTRRNPACPICAKVRP